MAKFKLSTNDKKTIKVEEKNIRVVIKDVFNSFNEDILGLGKIDKKSTQLNALSVFLI